MTKYKKQITIVLLAFLAFTALFGHLRSIPLGHEEPRRALIALELLYGHNPWQATLHGENYYRKPPLYNWTLAGLYALTGHTNELVSRLPSVFSYLLLTLFIYYFAAKYVPARQAAIAVLLFFISEDLILYYSRMAEMDLFYSLLSFPVIVLPWHYLNQQKLRHFFIIPPLLAGIGFISKGLPSIAFLGISMLAAIVLHKKYRLLYHPLLLASLLSFAFPLLFYFVPQWQQGTLHESVQTLMGESVNRTVSKGLGARLLHLLVFPLDFLKGMLPGSLLLVFLRKRHFTSPFIKAMAVLLIANLLLYLLSPGARLRYVYMLFPLLAIILSAVEANLNQTLKERFSMVFRLLTLVFTIALLSLGLLWFQLYWQVLWVVLLVIILLIINKRDLHYAYWLLALMCILRFTVDYTSVQPQFAQKDKSWLEKRDAEELFKLYGNRRVYFNTYEEQYYTFSYEYCRLSEQILYHNFELDDKDAVYLVHKAYMPSQLRKVSDFTIGKDSTFIIAEWP